MQTYVRLHPSGRDPEELLDPQQQVSEPWGGTIYGRCDKCGGSGHTDHECASCTATGADPSCPSCHGRVTYTDTCPTCEGSGEIDDSQRDGVSVFPTEEGLYRYMRRREFDFEDAKLVELEGRPAEEEDFDADEGALLVYPQRIVDVRDPRP